MSRKGNYDKTFKNQLSTDFSWMQAMSVGGLVTSIQTYLCPNRKTGVASVTQLGTLLLQNASLIQCVFFFCQFEV